MNRRDFLNFLISTGAIVFLGFENGCGSKESENLKQSLGIPAGAQKVLVLSQSSHWDINWQKTFDGYYRENVEGIINDSLVHLRYNNKNTYSICEIAFLKRYWDDHPEKREEMLKYYRENRLQIVGGGFTSPDTLLPTPDMLIMDWVLGNLWVNENLGGFPIAAWQPDSFGHSATLPDILSYLGYKYVGFSRIDGATAFMSWELKGIMEKLYGDSGYRKGSHGEYFLKDGISLFRWVGPGGGKVLAYWMPLTYCQGDDIDSVSPVTLPGARLTDDSNNEDLILKRIEGYINDLAPFSKNRKYLFVPVGCDFQSPHIHLAEYADLWNRRRYRETGVYAVTATFADFMKMAESDEKNIPVFQADLNPLWTGFYSYHPVLKEHSTVITENLTAAEMVNVFSTFENKEDFYGEIKSIWEQAVLIDHHDWIPGTSVPAVYYGEQLPDGEKLKAESNQLAGKIIRSYINSEEGDPTLVILNPFPFDVRYYDEIDVTLPDKYQSPGFIEERGKGQVFPDEIYSDGNVKSGKLVVDLSITGGTMKIIRLNNVDINTSPFVVEGDYGDYIEVRTAYYDPVQIEKSTGDIIELSFQSKKLIFNARGNQLLLYKDNGGPYRMGMELPCGDYTSIPATPSETQFEILDQQPFRWGVKYNGKYEGFSVEKIIWFFPDSPLLLFETEITPEGDLPEHVAWVSRFETALAGDKFLAHLPGGVYERKRESFYSPTYWPVEGWLKLYSENMPDVLFASAGNRAWRVDKDGVIEAVLLRNAKLEECANLGAWCEEKNGYRSRYLLYPAESLSNEDMLRYGFYFENGVMGEVISSKAEGEKTFFSLDQKDFLVLLRNSLRYRGIVAEFYNPFHLKEKIKFRLGLEGKFKIFKVNGREEKLEDVGNFSEYGEFQLSNPLESFLFEETKGESSG